ncbi:MAG: hypothetical protein WC867_02935 [Candidatus Pacearchaeota archaeon]|jgi:hypothetical protein
MDFRFYNSDRLIHKLIERGINNRFYKVCQGCVFTNISPVDCYHHMDDFHTPGIQSDCFCEHCCITIEDSQEKFYLSQDKDLPKKVDELENILEMASKES